MTKYPEIDTNPSIWEMECMRVAYGRAHGRSVAPRFNAAWLDRNPMGTFTAMTVEKDMKMFRSVDPENRAIVMVEFRPSCIPYFDRFGPMLGRDIISDDERIGTHLTFIGLIHDIQRIRQANHVWAHPQIVEHFLTPMSCKGAEGFMWRHCHSPSSRLTDYEFRA
jgi:hypothetical protein